MCNSPFLKTVSNGTRQKYIKIPCGQCIGCRIDKLKMWTARCEYEAKKGQNSFVTLTIDDLHLNFKENASRATLDRSELKKFFDRVYKAYEVKYKKKPDYKYFASAEYGGIFLRPHYHVLFFGLDFKIDQDIIKASWKYGNVDFKPLLRGGIRYVVDYFTKEHVNGKLAEERYDKKGLERPFISHSQGLGRGLYFENRDQIKETGKVKIGSKTFPVPTYYRSLLTDYTDEQAYTQTDAQYHEKKRMLRRMKANGFTNLEEYEEFLHKNNERELLEKMRNKGAIIDDRILNI